MAPYFGLTGGWLTFWVGDGPLVRCKTSTEYGSIGIGRLFDRHDVVWL